MTVPIRSASPSPYLEEVLVEERLVTASLVGIYITPTSGFDLFIWPHPLLYKEHFSLETNCWFTLSGTLL